MPAFRVLVATVDEALRRAAVTAFEEAGCEVLVSSSGSECVDAVRAVRPDLLALLPPFLWGSVGGALAALHDDPATRGVPVLVLSAAVGVGPFPRVPRLFAPALAEPSAALPPVIDRVSARMREFARSDSSPAAGRPAP